jgi:hypothetical protein
VVTVAFGFVGEPMILIAPLIMLLLSIGVGGSVLVSHRNEIEQTKERMHKAMKRIGQIQSARRTGKSATENEPVGEEEADSSGAAKEEGTREGRDRPLLDVDEEPAAEESASGRSSQRSRA